MILYVEYAKHSIEKLLEIISEFSKAVGYKTNIQKSVVFYRTRESEKELGTGESGAMARLPGVSWALSLPETGNRGRVERRVMWPDLRLNVLIALAMLRTDWGEAGEPEPSGEAGALTQMRAVIQVMVAWTTLQWIGVIVEWSHSSGGTWMA